MQFLRDGLRAGFSGGRLFWSWMIFLAILLAITGWNYLDQWNQGLVITGMSDQVSWGFYIANFAFFVGIAAAGVLLSVAGYIFHRQDSKAIVLIGETMAVAAVIVAMGFVAVDIGRLDRAWHVIPLLGRFNWPSSMLAWDIVVLNGYLLLNIFLPMYLLFNRYRGREPQLKKYFFWIVFTAFWAISIHTVTAWLLSSNVARPFWHSALLAPRFIASAFAAGPALLIIALQVIRRFTDYPVKQSVIDMLALIMAVTMQINIFFVAAEAFTDFYHQTEHGSSMHYLFLGLHGFTALKVWIWSALAMNIIATGLLMVHKTRHWMPTLNLACVLGFTGIWIEKGMGLIVPGFIPTPLGEIFEYAPTWKEIGVSAGIWGLGCLVFTVLVKAGIAIEQGRIGKYRECAPGVPEPPSDAAAGAPALAVSGAVGQG